MTPEKKKHPKVKTRLHPRNKNRERYDFETLIAGFPDLASFISMNKYDDQSIDFANPDAVQVLNKALLKLHYDIDDWTVPQNYLCPPIPGRADYIHHIADLLCRGNFGTIPEGPHIKCLDIGVGASCIYPIIGNKEYGWIFVGTDIDPVAIDSANKIIASNPSLRGNITCRLQENTKDIFKGIVEKDELFDLSVCNPPFHRSSEEARTGTLRKLNNLNQKKTNKTIRNFGGQSNELWCKGGEKQFTQVMIHQSKLFAKSCFWFSTLVSKSSNLKHVYQVLKDARALEVETLPMGQGNKTSRVVAWTFLSKAEQKQWKNSRWKVIDTK